MSTFSRFHEFKEMLRHTSAIRKEHIAYAFLMQNLDLDEMEKLFFLMTISHEWRHFVNECIKEKIIAITDTWEDTWLSMPDRIWPFYFGKNPIILSAYTIME